MCRFSTSTQVAVSKRCRWGPPAALWLLAALPIPAIPAIPARAQPEPTAPEQEQGNRAFTTERGFAEYRIGPGDELRVRIWTGVEAKEYEVTVQADGTVFLPFVGLVSLEVQGQSSLQLRDRIVERLRVSYRRPAAEVTVKTKVARVVTLLGEIRSTPRGSTGPGRYPLPGRIRLVDFITEHGGLTAQADLNNTQLTRNDRTYVYNLSRAIFQADMTQNPLLDDGDLVWVPSLKTSSRRVLVLGDVRTPGLIELPEEVPIAETIARSGGFLSTAHKSHVVVVRGDLENPTLLTANFESLKKGDLSQNFMIQDGDMVFVSRRKLSSFRDVMSTFATPLSMVLTSVFIGRAIDNQ